MSAARKKSFRGPLRGAKTSAPATVTLKHLAANLSEVHEMPKKHAEAVLGDLFGLVTKHLKKGDRLRIGGFGTLTVSKRAASVGRNQATGRLVQLTLRERGGLGAAKRVKMAARVLSEDLTEESAYEPAENVYEPSARARALLRGKEIRESDLKETGGAFSLEDVANFLDISRQAIDKKVQDDALLAVPGPHGRRRYPVIQFTSTGIVPGLQDVLKSLPSTDGWFRLNFLVNSDSNLGGRRPVDLLKKGRIDAVVNAARAVGVQGA